MSWDLAIPPWEAFAIIAMIIALIYALWRSIVWDHKMHMKDLRIADLERENKRLRREVWGRTRPRHVSGNGKTGA